MQIKDMVFGESYLVEVAFNANNVIHRAIAFDVRGFGEPDDMQFRLFNGSYEPEITDRLKPKDLAHFEVIDRVPMALQDGLNGKAGCITPALLANKMA